MCKHSPSCPPAEATDHDAARIVSDHLADGGYALLCNGVLLFSDGGELVGRRSVPRPSMPLPRSNRRACRAASGAVVAA